MENPAFVDHFRETIGFPDVFYMVSFIITPVISYIYILVSPRVTFTITPDKPSYIPMPRTSFEPPPGRRRHRDAAESAQLFARLPARGGASRRGLRGWLI